MKKTRFLSLLLCLVLLVGLLPTAAMAEDLKTFRLCMITWGDPPKDMDLVIDAINDKLVADGQDFQFQLEYINYEVWETKLNMMLSTQESFDAFLGMQDVIPWTSYQARGAILPVDEYLDQYGSNLKKMIPESAFAAISAEGKTWGIPCYGSSISSNPEWITIRRDFVDQYNNGVVPTTYDELLEYVKNVYEGYGAQAWPKVTNDGGSYLHRSYETYPFTVVNEAIYIDQDGNVKAWIDTDEFKKDAEFWYTCVSNGWTSPDILTLDASVATETMNSIEGASLHSAISVTTTTPQELEAQAPGAKLDVIMLKPELGYFNSTGINHCWMVPVTSANPELAVRFFDWLYSDSANHDLLLYGIKDVHWQESETEIAFGDVSEKCISYLTDEQGNRPWVMDFWAIGNMNMKRYAVTDFPAVMNCDRHILYGEQPELLGKALGFVFDTTNVTTEWVNVQAEISASLWPIKYGIVAYEDGYAGMRERFTAAGIDKVVEEYQRQLNDFLGK